MKTLLPALLAAAFVVAPASAQDLPSWAAPGIRSAPPPPAAPMGVDPGTPGDNPPQIPVDGGLGLLAAAGAGYAANRLRQRRRAGSEA